MSKNPILDDIRRTREKLLAESGGTLEGLVHRLQAEEKASGRARRGSQPTGHDVSPTKAETTNEATTATK